MNVPRKIIVLLLIGLGLTGVFAGSAGASEQPQLVNSSTDMSCGYDGNVVVNLMLINVSQQPINVQANEPQTNGFHELVGLLPTQSVTFDFPLGTPEGKPGTIYVDAAIPGHEDDDTGVQAIQADYPPYDCRNAHEPADTPTSVPTNPTTSTLPATTTSLVGQPFQISATSVMRETTTTSVAPTLASPPVLAYTGKRWIGTEWRIALICLVLGIYLCYQARRYGRRKAHSNRINQRKSAIAAARQS